MKKITITFKLTADGNKIPYRRRKHIEMNSTDVYGQPVTCNLPCARARNNVNHIKNRTEGINTPLPDTGKSAPSQYEIFPWLRMGYMNHISSMRLSGNRIHAAYVKSESLVTGSASLPLRLISLPYLNGGYYEKISKKINGKIADRQKQSVHRFAVPII